MQRQGGRTRGPTTGPIDPTSPHQVSVSVDRRRKPVRPRAPSRYHSPHRGARTALYLLRDIARRQELCTREAGVGPGVFLPSQGESGSLERVVVREGKISVHRVRDLSKGACVDAKQ